MYLFLLILIVVSYCRDFFSLIFEQSHCISSCSFSKLWIYYCPELCVNLFLGIWAEALDFFFPLQSHKCPKGVDKELEFCVTTIREFWLCFLSLYLLEITENHTTILVTQFACLMEEREVSFSLGFAPFSGWLTKRCCPYFCLCSSHAFDLGSTYIDFYTLLRPCLLLLGQLKQGIPRNVPSMSLIPSALLKAKGKAAAIQAHTYSAFENQQWERASSTEIVPIPPPTHNDLYLNPNLSKSECQQNLALLSLLPIPLRCCF